MKLLLPLFSLCLLSACGAADSPADRWSGKWTGPEGTFLEIAGSGGKYRITVRNLDGPRTFDGVARGDRITFERDGASESIRAGSGAETGMKWLADKSDCLVVKPGEGYCRGWSASSSSRGR